MDHKESKPTTPRDKARALTDSLLSFFPTGIEEKHQ